MHHFMAGMSYREVPTCLQVQRGAALKPGSIAQWWAVWLIFAKAFRLLYGRLEMNECEKEFARTYNVRYLNSNR